MINLKKFWRDEEGQDLIEYTLLLAFVCLVAAAIFIPVGTGVSSVWSATNDVTSAAGTAAAAAATAAAS